MKRKLCGSNKIIIISGLEKIHWKSIWMLSSQCFNCGREFISKDQIIENNKRVKQYVER